ncbi:DUF302 domain-containing protein [Aliiroseovarius subalbicans]|uniref:DUF302 domain-containing protein n=1 Tax=Aliiroseovarius subalbicans TaxID=2925840 RepID=UPI001F5AB06E|nr:DUF302 domain-containing protein [Aliiroseovarius subalbicans]MCI2398123.1 DUF302 domain-containing protein [Aliiroseovarius subalbicans]
MYKILTATAALALTATTALADNHGSPAVTYPFDGSFEDATFAVESAIVGAGLVIDYVSHTGEMLARTGADVGSDVELFAAADIFLFCSAVTSRKVMEANPMNIAHCPYGIFVADQGGEVVVGYRKYPEGEMQEVQALLDGLVKEVVE